MYLIDDTPYAVPRRIPPSYNDPKIMRPLRKWDEYPLVEVRGVHVEEGECRLMEGYVVQRYQESGLFLFSEIADLMQYEVESAEQKKKTMIWM
ncbi:MAG: hypothetical protein ACK5CA_09315 [Cyanobacteriota bacterium]